MTAPISDRTSASVVARVCAAAAGVIALGAWVTLAAAGRAHETDVADLVVYGVACACIVAVAVHVVRPSRRPGPRTRETGVAWVMLGGAMNACARAADAVASPPSLSSTFSLLALVLSVTGFVVLIRTPRGAGHEHQDGLGRR